MIFGLYVECGAHVFLRARQLYAFVILLALKNQPSLLDPDNSVRRETNKNHVLTRMHIIKLPSFGLDFDSLKLESFPKLGSYAGDLTIKSH